MALPSGAFDTILEGRLLTTDPHTDAIYIDWANNLKADSANLVLTRNAAGDWSLNRTAAGAETYNIVTGVDLLDRLASLQLADVGTRTFALKDLAGSTVKRGIKITKVSVAYQVGVVSLTSAALVLKKVVHTNGAALSITDIPLTVSFTGKLAASSNLYVVDGTVNSPDFLNADNAIALAEAQFVMANTGTLRVYAIIFHLSYNYA